MCRRTIQVEVVVAGLQEAIIDHVVRHVADVRLVDCGGTIPGSSTLASRCIKPWLGDLQELSDAYSCIRFSRVMRPSESFEWTACGALFVPNAFQVLNPIAGVRPSPLSRASHAGAANTASTASTYPLHMLPVLCAADNPAPTEVTLACLINLTAARSTKRWSSRC